MGIRLWAFWRRLQYTIGFFVFCGVLGSLIYWANFYTAPTCLDGTLNGEETGVDCGGTCVQICPATVQPLKIVWAESFKIADGQYNAVAYIENANKTAGHPAVKYKIELFANGKLVADRTGEVAVPPDGIYPIFAGRLATGVGVEVSETRITLEPQGSWLPVRAVDTDRFKSSDIDLTSADDSPKLVVSLENTSLTPAREVEVVATIFDDAGNPVTASETYVEFISPRETESIVFTWPNPIAKTVRSCEIPTDVVLAIDLSGSMNNDGGEPPQPVTSALSAAAQFVNSLQTKDQVSVVTFATDAKLVSPLSNQHTDVAGLVTDLTINPAEETGYTNTVAALNASSRELSSVRHNDNARRVLVLLTDGLPTAKGEGDVVRAAQADAQILSGEGVEIYAIGLGSGVDRTFIENIASDRDNAYFAPSGSDLRNIYSEITSSLCEVGPTKIDVIAKPKIDFAPITD